MVTEINYHNCCKKVRGQQWGGRGVGGVKQDYFDIFNNKKFLVFVYIYGFNKTSHHRKKISPCAFLQSIRAFFKNHILDKLKFLKMFGFWSLSPIFLGKHPSQRKKSSSKFLEFGHTPLSRKSPNSSRKVPQKV